MPHEGKKLVILMGVMADKDVEDMLELLSPIAEAVVTLVSSERVIDWFRLRLTRSSTGMEAP